MPPTDALTSRIHAAYRDRTPASRQLYEQSEQILPASASRSATAWSPYPLYVDRAAGPHFHDVDGHQYLDLNNNSTSLIHGHAYPPIAAALSDVQGTAVSANSPAMLDLAARLVDRVPSVEQVRFTVSASEACLLALALARAVTGRHRILVAPSAYHGSIGQFAHVPSVTNNPDLLFANFNDLDDIDRVLTAHGQDVAAIFIEPVLVRAGIIPATTEFLAGLADRVRRAGALLVYDEAVTFRLHPGGVQSQQNQSPDLTVFGKFIGGGYPAGAVGGRRELLDRLRPGPDHLMHSNTFAANPVAMTAGTVALDHLTPDRIQRLDRLAARFEGALKPHAHHPTLPLRIRRVGSLLNLAVTPHTGTAENHTKPTTTDLARLLHLACLNHGLAIGLGGLACTSTVMTDDHVDDAAHRLAAALADLRNDSP